jgi:hypothetical protein
LPEPSYVTDGTVAIMGALFLFIVPRKAFFFGSHSHPRGHLAAARMQ